MDAVLGVKTRRRKQTVGASKKKASVTPLPSSERLRHLFAYDPDTGILSRRVSTAPNARKGQPVGSKHNAGYLQMQVDGKKYLAHRVIWRLVTGDDPGELEVDHKNGDRSDNTWGNLRLATKSQQRGNRVVEGCGRHRDGYMVLFRKQYHGVYKTKEEAQSVYRKLAETEWGEFAGHLR